MLPLLEDMFRSATNAERAGFIYFWTIKPETFSPCCSDICQRPPGGHRTVSTQLNNLDMNPKLVQCDILPRDWANTRPCGIPENLQARTNIMFFGPPDQIFLTPNLT